MLRFYIHSSSSETLQGKLRNFLLREKCNDTESLPLLLSEFPYKVINGAYFSCLPKCACSPWVNTSNISHVNCSRPEVRQAITEFICKKVIGVICKNKRHGGSPFVRMKGTVASPDSKLLQQIWDHPLSWYHKLTQNSEKNARRETLWSP